MAELRVSPEEGFSRDHVVVRVDGATVFDEVGSPSRCRDSRERLGFVSEPGQAGLFAVEAAGRAHPFTDRRWWRRSGPARLAQLLVSESVAFDGLLEEPLERQSAAA